MDAITLAKLEAVYNTINVKREEDKKVKLGLERERKERLYGNVGITVYRTESGYLGAVLPTGMSAVKLSGVVVKCREKIEEFKIGNEQILKL